MKRGSFKKASLHAGLVLVLVIIAARMLVYGVSDYFLPAAYDGDDAATDIVLSWHADSAKGLYLKAKQLETADPQQASQLLYRALHHNPADVRPLAVLARIMAAQNSVEDADHLMTLASNEMPANKSLHLRAANYWIERLELDKALHAWHLALSIDPGLGSQLFPVFIRVLENPQIQQSILSFALKPPSWWERFVAYAAANAQQPSTALLLYNYRGQSRIPLSHQERQYLVQRSIRDEQWKQAYLIWVEGLTSAQRRSLAGVYDGSFEHTRDEQPFGWQLMSSRYTKTQVRPSYGVDGQSVLMVKFDKEEIRYQHLFQRLLLPSGEYLFTANKRTQNLAGRGRLKWFVRCSSANGRIVGESRPLLPSMEWEPMQFSFTVPDSADCLSQVIRLESIGKHPFDHKLSGVLWIDNINVGRIKVASSE
jgi:hypothetical protein